MGVECTSCGHSIPSGQFRCGKCGAVQTRDSFEDYAGIAEAAQVEEPVEAAEKRALGTGPELAVQGAIDMSSASTDPPAADPGASPAVRREDETPAPRESIVPKGTFTSDSAPSEDVRTSPDHRESASTATTASSAAIAATASTGTRSTPPTAATSAPPAPRDPAGREPSGRVQLERSQTREVTGDDASRAAAATSSQRRAKGPTRPPYLASEILREDLAPSEPGAAVLVRVLGTAGSLGVVCALASGVGQLESIFVALVSVVLVLLSRLRMSYPARATAAGSLAGFALGVVSWWRVVQGGGVDGPWLATATTLLASALFFRAWYRSSNPARSLVGVAVVLAFSWAAMTAHRNLLELEFAWHSILPALTWYLFVILCLLSLLAFMGDETTGGCAAWATGLFLWYALFALVRASMDSYIGGPTSPAKDATVLGLAEPAFSAPAAVSLAQLLARLLGPRSRRFGEPSNVSWR